VSFSAWRIPFLEFEACMYRAQWLLVGMFAVALGCAKSPDATAPVTHSAKGTLVGRDGKPVTGGTIQFRSADSTRKPSTTAMVKSDGTFELQVLDNAGNKHLGAEAGTYTVIYLPAMTEDQNIVPVTLPKKVVVEVGGNRFNLKLP
jgi:hypothetical protein